MLLALAIETAIAAGKEILQVKEHGYHVSHKMDQSPVTSADIAAHRAISRSLSETGIPVLSEEAAAIPYADRKIWDTFWLIDPLDGTREFIENRLEYCVCIALIKKGTPVLGVIYIPEETTVYYGSYGKGAYRLKLKNNHDFIASSEIFEAAEMLPLSQKHINYVVGCSRSHCSEKTKEYIAALQSSHPTYTIKEVGSAIKFCLVASGEIDIYPKLETCMEWDSAAGQAIVEASGGTVTTYKEKMPLEYNKEQLENPWFIAHRKE